MLTLIIGNRNYSSWSLRPWIAMRAFDIPFETVVIALDQPDTATRIREHSPSGRVPVLMDRGQAIWDSLAICETMAERHPEKHLWPVDPQARAWARSVACEMHSGFAKLREHMPMKVKERFRDFDWTPAREDVKRIDEIWTRWRRAYGGRGPYLFGAFTIADAMYAPVVFRANTYGFPLSEESAAYRDTMLAHPAMKEWAADAAAEDFRMARYEK
jgi:glutathione S-transferase